MYLPPGHPIIAIRNNRNQNGRRIGKKVYSLTNNVSRTAANSLCMHSISATTNRLKGVAPPAFFIRS